MDDQTRTQLEAATFRALMHHLLEKRPDVQNIDLMNLAGFCRNCLSRWYQEAADAHGIPLSKEEARETVYGMPYAEWVARHQTEASAAQQAAFAKSFAENVGAPAVRAPDLVAPDANVLDASALDADAHEDADPNIGTRDAEAQAAAKDAPPAYGSPGATGSDGSSTSDPSPGNKG